MTLGHYLGRQQTCRNLQHICQGCFGYWLFNEKRNIFSDCHSGRLGWPIILWLWKYVTGSWHDIGTKRQWQNPLLKNYKIYCLWFPKAAYLLLCPPLSWIELNRIECLHFNNSQYGFPSLASRPQDDFCSCWVRGYREKNANDKNAIAQNPNTKSSRPKPKTSAPKPQTHESVAPRDFPAN